MSSRAPPYLPAVLTIALLGALGASRPGAAHGDRKPGGPGEPLGFTTLDDQILYFVMVDRFRNGDRSNDRPGSPDPKGAFHGGDLQGLRQKLPYLADLGVTAIWLTPVARQVDVTVTAAGFPDAAYHGYWPDDLGGIEPRFGDDDQLRGLVDEAHALGMRVILDVVINHVGYRASLTARKDLIRSGDGCPSEQERTERTMCLLGLPDFKTEKPEVRAYVVDKTARWVRDFPIDGFRLDALKHVEPELIAELRAAVEPERRGHPFLFLGEDWGAAPSQQLPGAIADGRADTLIDFSFDGLVEGFLSGRMRAEAVAHHLKRRHEAIGPPMAHFIDSHDVTTLLTRLPPHTRHRYPLAALLQMSVRGMPIVTWGDEIGRLGGAWPHNRQDMDWEALERPADAATHAIWRAMTRVRRAKPALRGKAFTTILARSEPTGGASLVYQRGAGAQAVIVALRRGPGPARVPLPAASGADRWCLLASTDASAMLWEATGPQTAQALALPADTGVMLGACPL
jgi:glycosidase